jgi:predicted Fe-Mo cluster-binding NifX family protein
MTKAAFATWNNRIAPVFDVARSIQLVETQAGQIIHQTQADVAGDIPNQKAWRLAELEVETLVCGAISRPLQVIIAAYGIEVIPFVAGNLQEVIQAWVDGKLAGAAAYAMPGCRSAGGRRFKGSHGTDRRENKMKGNKRGKKGAAGQGPGYGGQARQGQGGGRQRQGRGGRTPTSGFGVSATQSTCICPKCGHQAPHERGVPCMQLKCAQCGTVMTRQ